jgi:hypothetical protein
VDKITDSGIGAVFLLHQYDGYDVFAQNRMFVEILSIGKMVGFLMQIRFRSKHEIAGPCR